MRCGWGTCYNPDKAAHRWPAATGYAVQAVRRNRDAMKCCSREQKWSKKQSKMSLPNPL